MQTSGDFVNRYRGVASAISSSDRRLLSDETFRRLVYKTILHDEQNGLHSFVRQLLEHQIELHANLDCVTDDYSLCVFLLARYRDLSDTELLWKAKNANFDTHMGLPIALLVMSGVHETIAFLEESNTKESIAAAEYISQCSQLGSFNDLESIYKSFESDSYWEIEKE